MDRDIKNIRQLWNTCKNQIHGNGCEDIFRILHQMTKDFQWGFEGYMFYRKNYISLRVAYQSMIVLMFSSMVKEPWVNTFKNTVNWFKDIKNEYDDITKYLHLYGRKLQEERPFEIGAAEVCEMKLYLWKEFEQPACEKRWDKTRTKENNVKRSVVHEPSMDEDEDDDDNLNNDKYDKDVSSDKKIFFDTFAKPDWDSLDRIGGTSEYDLVMQARFTDFDGKKVFNTQKKEFNVMKKSKGDVIENLIDLTVDKRNVYVKKILNDIDHYLQRTLNIVEKASRIFKKELKKKLSYWKGQINNNKYGHTV